jgi:hypothetical protein
MATRRKYKVPHFRDGGRVMQDMPIADDAPAEAGGFPSGILGDHLEHAGAAHGAGIEDVIRSAPPPTGPPADDNPLQKALDAQTRAEEMQRNPTSAIDRHIAGIPGLSEHKRAFLRQFPVLVEDRDVMSVFNKHYAEALQSGFTDDTPELDSHLITATVRDLEHRRQLALAAEPEDVAVQRLDDEVEAIRRSEAPPAPIAPPPAAPPKRRVVYSAPVSREVPLGAGEQRPGAISLNREEREIAHSSFKHLPPAQAEYEYYLNKKKMIAMKANGSIQGDW